MERGEQAAVECLFTDMLAVMKSEDAVEGVMSFMQRRDAVFRAVDPHSIRTHFTPSFVDTMSLRPTLDFMLYDWLNVEQLCQRPRHAEHNRETFDAVLDLSQKLADEQFAPTTDWWMCKNLSSMANACTCLSKPSRRSTPFAALA